MCCSVDCRSSSCMWRNSKSLCCSLSSARRLRLQSDAARLRSQIAQLLPSYHLLRRRFTFSGEGLTCARHSWPQSPLSGQREHDFSRECSWPRRAVQDAYSLSVSMSAGCPESDNEYAFWTALRGQEH